MATLPVAVSVVKAPVLAVVDPIGVFWMLVALNAPDTLAVEPLSEIMLRDNPVAINLGTKLADKEGLNVRSTCPEATCCIKVMSFVAIR